MIEYEKKRSEAFRKNDPIRILMPQGPIFAMVTGQYHQWLHTTAGTFNVTDEKIPIFRGIERYEDHGYC